MSTATTRGVPVEAATTGPALVVKDLRVVGVPSGAAVVEQIDLEVGKGEIVGLVGESGSGKTTLGLAFLKYCKRGTRLVDGRIVLGGTEIDRHEPAAMRRVRGRKVAYIPQSPASALNPALRIGTQLRECLPGGKQAGDARVREVLREVALPEDDEFLARYPHQLSGGQQQRVVIAMAFIGYPGLIVLDEPTTGLDVTTQKHVLETVRRMCANYGCAAVYISHDMAVVAELADRIAVMYSGRIVEIGPTDAVLRSPRHPYTARLLMAVPDLDGQRQMLGIPGHAPSPLHRPAGCAFAPRCPLADDHCRREVPAAEPVGPDHVARCFKAGAQPLQLIARTAAASGLADPPPSVLEVRGLSARYGRRRVLESVDLVLPRGHCVALLGESGSGKTTLARSIVGLHPEYDGEVRLGGEALARRSFQRTREQRRRVQYVFQNPYESLNPRKTVRDLVLGPAGVLLGHIADPERTLAEALEQAALRPDLAGRYPDQLSGGERQRVAIARAVAVRPDVLVCDEVTSALDVSVQSAIVELLHHLQKETGLTLVFVTHNIALVRNIADSVAVLERGQIVEHGTVEHLFRDPQHLYTRALIADTPNFQLADEPHVGGPL